MAMKSKVNGNGVGDGFGGKSPQLYFEMVCTVCIESLATKKIGNEEGNYESAVVTLCGHTFHEQCIQKWLTTRNPAPQSQNVHGNCPVCNSVVWINQNRKIFPSLEEKLELKRDFRELRSDYVVMQHKYEDLCKEMAVLKEKNKSLRMKSKDSNHNLKLKKTGSNSILKIDFVAEATAVPPATATRRVPTASADTARRVPTPAAPAATATRRVPTPAAPAATATRRVPTPIAKRPTATKRPAEPQNSGRVKPTTQLPSQASEGQRQPILKSDPVSKMLTRSQSTRRPATRSTTSSNPSAVKKSRSQSFRT